MPKSTTEIKQEIVEQIAASAELGQNVRSVRMDVERFSESVVDIVMLERMKAKVSDTQKLHFASGQEHELHRVLEYLTSIQEHQPEDKAMLLRLLCENLAKGVHHEENW